MTSSPLTPVQSPVTLEEAADFIGVDASDPLLTMVVPAATDAAIAFMQTEIMPRARRAVWNTWPRTGFYGGIDRQGGQLLTVFELPYSTNETTISAAKINGAVVNMPELLEGRPSKVRFDQAQAGAAVEIEYVTGYNAVPDAIRLGVLQMVVYWYEHRGACSGADALAQSGAAETLRPYRLGVL
jgi:hypothetical protein